MSARGRGGGERAPFVGAHAIEIDGLRVTRGARLVLPDLDLRVLGLDYKVGITLEGDQREMPDRDVVGPDKKKHADEDGGDR